MLGKEYVWETNRAGGELKGIGEKSGRAKKRKRLPGNFEYSP